MLMADLLFGEICIGSDAVRYIILVASEALRQEQAFGNNGYQAINPKPRHTS